MQDIVGLLRDFWVPCAISAGILLLTSWLWSYLISNIRLRKIRTPITIALAVLLFCIGTFLFVRGVQPPTKPAEPFKSLIVSSSLWLLALSFLSAFFQERLQEYQFQARWLAILEKLNEEVVKEIQKLPSPMNLNSRAIAKVLNDLWAYAQVITKKAETTIILKRLERYGEELYLHYDVVNRITFGIARRYKVEFKVPIYFVRLDAEFSLQMLAQYSRPEDKWNLPYDILYYESTAELIGPARQISAEVRLYPTGPRGTFKECPVSGSEAIRLISPGIELIPDSHSKCEVEWSVRDLMHPAAVRALRFGAFDVIADEWRVVVKTGDSRIAIRSAYVVGSPLLKLAITPAANQVTLVLQSGETVILPQDSIIVAFDIKES